MAPRPIVVRITGDADDLEAAARRAAGSLDDLGDSADRAGGAAGGFGDKAGGVAKDKLGPLGDAAGMAGIDLANMGAGAAVAGAAVVALGAFVAQGVTKIVDLTDEVRKFKTVSGATWEESSRFVAIADDLGVAAETAAGSMGKLALSVDAGKLAEFNIEVVRTVDGTVDMVATFGNVADAMNRTTDPAKRAAMGAALLGKSWADIAPLMQQGSAGIREMAAGVAAGHIVTEESAASAREWSMAMDDAEDAISALQMSLAKDLIPELTKMATEGAETIATFNTLTDKVGGLGNVLKVVKGVLDPWGSLNDGIRELTGEVTAADAAAEDLAVKFDGAELAADALAKAGAVLATETKVLADRQKDAAATTKALGDQLKIQEDQVKSLRDTVMTIVGTQLAFEAAQRATTAAAADLVTKTEDLRKAQETYGDGTPQATQAQLDYEGSLAGSKEQADKTAKAHADLAREQAKATGEVFGAEEANLVYRDALVKVRDAMTDPTLISGMNDLIALVDVTVVGWDAAAKKANAAEQAFRSAAGAAAGALSVDSSGAVSVSPIGSVEFPGRAHGGPVSAGRPYMVGEQGPEMIIPGQNGTVLNNQQTGQALGGAGTTIVINSPIGRPDDVVAWLREQLRRSERARR